MLQPEIPALNAENLSTFNGNEDDELSEQELELVAGGLNLMGRVVFTKRCKFSKPWRRWW